MRYPMRYLHVALAIMALMAGALLALSDSDPARAGSEDIRWMSGVSSSWKFCFGTAGWHDGGTAADLFADAVSPCNDPDSASDPVWAQSYGRSTVWGTYNMLGIAYNGGTAYTYCANVMVDVYRWNPDLSVTKVATEWYKHTGWKGGDPDWYDLKVGGGSWQLTSRSLGSTVYPDNCDSSAFHVHQMLFSGSVLMTNTNDPALGGNGVYDLFSVDRYIHDWNGGW
jgi:hypothetical protein